MSDLDDAVFYLHGQLRDRSGLIFDRHAPGVVVGVADGTTAVHMNAELENGLVFSTSYDVGPAGELRVWEDKYEPTAAHLAGLPKSPAMTYAPGWWRTVRGSLNTSTSAAAEELSEP